MLRLLATVVAVVSLLAGAVGTATHYIGLENTTWTLVASFTPLFMVVTVVALMVLVFLRQRVLAVVGVAVLAAGVWAQVPLYRSEYRAEAGDAPVVRVMQANIFLGQADTAALARTVRERHVDILTVSELTGGAARRLSSDGLGRELPYSFLRPREGGGGTGIFSRYPLRDGTALPGFVLTNLRATVDIPGTEPTAVYALHPLPPYPEPAYRWMAELGELHRLLGAEAMPLIVGADFNSTWDHQQYRRVLETVPPLRDAAEYVGAGIVATYPANRGYPAILAIDRILTRGATPMSFSRIDNPGSDHFAVVGEVRLGGG
ncbi:endonuclease/exonuclease/phosphatase family protein [soil metagenome]